MRLSGSPTIGNELAPIGPNRRPAASFDDRGAARRRQFSCTGGVERGLDMGAEHARLVGFAICESGASLELASCVHRLLL